MKVICNLKKYLFDRFPEHNALLEQRYSKTIVFQSLIIGKENRNKESIEELSEIEFSCFPQWGEDGIIDCLDEVKSHPSFIREVCNSSANITFIQGNEHVDIINHLPVFDLESNSVKLTGDFADHYSPSWSQVN